MGEEFPIRSGGRPTEEKGLQSPSPRVFGKVWPSQYVQNVPAEVQVCLQYQGIQRRVM